MRIFALQNLKIMKIIGTGSATPHLVVTNNDLTKFLDTTDEWIRTRTGIQSRNILSTDTITELASKACLDCIKNAGVEAGEIDYLLCHTVVYDAIIPSLATIIQDTIGTDCPTLDLNAACTGFIYALDVADSLIKAGKAKKVLIVCAEEPSKFVDWNQRETCVLFGDGAGAVLVTEGGEDCKFHLKTQHTDALFCGANYGNSPFDKTEEKCPYMFMKGRDVFKLAVQNSKKDIENVLTQAQLSCKDVKYYLLHQANMRILEAIKGQLDLEESQLPHNIEHTGNTSSASIPLLLDEMNKSEQLSEGDVLVFSAFGAGFTSGACLIKWGKNI